jgi:hypothetical protein
MDNSIPPYRADVVSVQTSRRPTPTPARVQFSDLLAGGAQALVRGAQAAVSVLPGSPLAAVAVRGGGSGTSASGALDLSSAGSSASLVSVGATPEGPGGSAGVGATVGGVSLGVGAAGGTASSGASSTSDGGLESSMAQAQQENLYYLQIQEEVNAQNRTFTALSNVLEVEHSTAKSAIGNIH